MANKIKERYQIVVGYSRPSSEQWYIVENYADYLRVVLKDINIRLVKKNSFMSIITRTCIISFIKDSELNKVITDEMAFDASFEVPEEMQCKINKNKKPTSYEKMIDFVIEKENEDD